MLIDTGPVTHPADRLIPDWFLDGAPPDADKNRLMHDYAYHVIGAMRNPVKLETVRRHVLAEWAFVAELAKTHPAVFDELICAYAERVLE